MHHARAFPDPGSNNVSRQRMVPRSRNVLLPSIDLPETESLLRNVLITGLELTNSLMREHVAILGERCRTEPKALSW